MEGDLVQGSLIRAQTSPGTQVYLNDVPVAVNSHGEFVFALWRDTPPEVRLELEREGGVSWLRRIEVLSIAQREWRIQRIEGVASDKVTPPARDYNRIANEKSNLRTALTGEIGDERFAVTLGEGFTQPTQGVVSGIFGSQRFFNGHPRRPHYGLDIAATSGTIVIAPADGTVRFAHTDMFFNGKTLVLSHGQGVFASFVHLSAILVEEGQKVERNQPIARVGATGRVTGPHLHWQISYLGIPVDPALLLRDDSPVCVKRLVEC